MRNTGGNECFQWCLVKYLNPVDHNLRKISKTGKYCTKRLGFKDIKFPVRTYDINKFEKNIPLALAFLVIEIRKSIQSMHQTNVAKKTISTNH